MRLDVYLVTKGYFESRNKAAAAVKEKTFSVNGKIVDKPSYEVQENACVRQVAQRKNYVARSAHKLLKAYETFDLQWQDYIVADLGASTGGFCQVLLENGVRRVYAVDIGTAQLHPSLVKDPRIVNVEHMNARFIDQESFDEPISAVTADLSFISLKAVLPAIYRTLSSGGEAITLIKPQFEAGPQHLNKSGVITERKVRCNVVENLALFAESCGFGVHGLAFSGLSGESGNEEFLMYLKKDIPTSISISSAARLAVYSEESHA